MMITQEASWPAHPVPKPASAPATAATPVSHSQRHTRRNPCCICGGHTELRQGKGERCAGYRSTDGEYEYCQREQFAGKLSLNENTTPPTYAHKLHGDCTCGTSHGAATLRPVRPERPLREHVTRYELRDADGKLAGVHVRTDRADGTKAFRWERHNGRGAAAMPLYRLADHLAAPADALRIVCEGEKATDALHAALERSGRTDLVALGTVTGAPAFPCDDSLRPLVGYRVALWPDHDRAGRQHMERIAVRLEAMGAPAPQWMDWQDAPAKGDAADFFATGGTAEGLLRLVTERRAPSETEEPPTEPPEEPDKEPDKAEKAERGLSIAVQLVTLATQDGTEYFHDTEGTTWATIPVSGHQETYALHSKSFKRWLARLLYEAEKKSPNAQALQDALLVLDGKATFEGSTVPVHIRLAEHDGAIYLDLADDGWRAVKITAVGWSIVSGSAIPVKFRRSKGMLPLPVPVAGGTLEMLHQFVNLNQSADGADGADGTADWVLLVAWLVAALRPSGPYPVLALSGEQGSAKSTQARLLRMLLDPNVAALRSEPKELRDLAIAANNSWTIVLDNLSGMPTWLSDGLCRLSTGGGSAYRTLYENDEETIFDAQRPIILTGIEEVATRGDLVDRAILLSLPTIPDAKRQPESAYWLAFERVRAAILGALLTAVSGALKALPTIKLNSLPRMADFALWATAAEKALGWKPNTFMTAYTANRASANELTLEASLVAGAVMRAIQPGATWSGTMAELHAALLKQDATLAEKHGWPTTARGLSGAIKRIAPNLRAAGFTITFALVGRNKARTYTMERANEEDTGETPSAPSAEGEKAEGTGTPLRTVPRDADGTTVRSDSNRPQETPESIRGADGADGADGTIPSHSNGHSHTAEEAFDWTA